MKHLLTRGEAIKWSGLNQFSPCNLNDIYSVIYSDICECFGRAFYDELVENLEDYSDAKEWTEKEYLTGETVMYDGCYWTALETTSDYPSEPCWELSKKFKKDCLNDFWCSHFARYLSYLIVRESIVDASVPLTNSGAVVNYGDGYKSDTKFIAITQGNYSKKIQREFRLIEDWIYDCKADCFNATKQLAVTCCGGCGCLKEKCRCDNCHIDKASSRMIIVC